MRLSSAQRFILREVAIDGPLLGHYDRTRYSLQRKGLIEVNAAGKYVLTAAGREAMTQQNKEPNASLHNRTL